MSLISSGFFRGARFVSEKILRNREAFTGLELKGKQKVADVLTLSYKELRAKEVVSSRFDLAKLRVSSVLKALTEIPKALVTLVKRPFAKKAVAEQSAQKVAA